MVLHQSSKEAAHRGIRRWVRHLGDDTKQLVQELEVAVGCRARRYFKLTE